jgi:flagellar hook-length control protein FliK
MQVNLMSMTGPAGSGRESLLPNVLKLLEAGAMATLCVAMPREQCQEDREEKLARKDADSRQAAAAAAATPRPSELIAQAERDMLPGSQAARREQLHAQVEQHAGQDRQAFRQALADAAGRDPGSRASSLSREAGQGTRNSGVDAAGSEQSGSSAAGRPIGARAAQSSSFAPPAPSGSQAGTSGANGGSTGGGTGGGSVGTGFKPVPQGLAAAGSGVRFSVPIGTSTLGPTQSNLRAHRAGTGVSLAGGALGARGMATQSVAMAPGARVMAPSDALRRHAAAGPEAEPKGSFDPNIERILRLIRARLASGRSVTTLRLEPPELGTVRLRMDLRNDQLSLAVEAETPAARRLLSEQIDSLRRNLEASGIHLERVEIRTPEVTEPPQLWGGPAGPGHDWPGAAWGGPGGSGQTEAGRSGGGPPGEMESPSADPSEYGSQEMTVAPAAESRVNIWA